MEDSKLNISQIEDLSEELRLLGERVADARRESAKSDLDYRHWRAITTEDIASRNRKFPEWRVKAAVEAQPGYAARKTKALEALCKAQACESMYFATQVKAMLIASTNIVNPTHWLTNSDKTHKSSE